MFLMNINNKGTMDFMNDLINNIARLHTTSMGLERIRYNLSLNDTDIVKWC